MGRMKGMYLGTGRHPGDEVLFRFYDFPAAQWVHLHTTHPIESTFATSPSPLI